MQSEEIPLYTDDSLTTSVSVYVTPCAVNGCPVRVVSGTWIPHWVCEVCRDNNVVLLTVRDTS